MKSQNPIALLHLGERATQFYLQRLDPSSVDLIPCDFAELNEFLPAQFDQLTPRLERVLNACFEHQTVIIPNITLHETLDKHCKPRYRQLPIVHPLTNAAAKLGKLSTRPITILGSSYTMQSPYVAQYFGQLDKLLMPLGRSQQTQVDELRRAVYEGLENREQLSSFKQLVLEAGGQAELVIACTELSLVLDSRWSSPQTILDLSRLQLEQARL